MHQKRLWGYSHDGFVWMNPTRKFLGRGTGCLFFPGVVWWNPLLFVWYLAFFLVLFCIIVLCFVFFACCFVLCLTAASLRCSCFLDAVACHFGCYSARVSNVADKLGIEPTCASSCVPAVYAQRLFRTVSGAVCLKKESGVSPRIEASRGGGYSCLAYRSHLTVAHAFVSRRDIVRTPNRDTSKV